MQRDKEVVLKELKVAYADCILERKENEPEEEFQERFENSLNERILRFKCSKFLSPSDAFEVMNEVCQSYNDFSADLIKLFPNDCQILLAREGSVCLYVKKGESELPVEETEANEIDEKNDLTRYWWD